MNRHLERIKAEEEAFFKGKKRRNRVPFLTILLAFAMLFVIKQVNAPKATEKPAPIGEDAIVLTQPEERYWNLRLISAASPITEDFAITLGEYEGVAVDTRIVPSLRQLMRAAEADGISLSLLCGYRSIAQQQSLCEELSAELLGLGYTESECASLIDNTLEQPGESDYHTGLAVCFGSADQGEALSAEAEQWLLAHAAQYGFILRYPAEKEAVTLRAQDAAHYRYVGPETAAYMKEWNLCLEEYRQQVFTQNTTPGEG